MRTAHLPAALAALALVGLNKCVDAHCRRVGAR
jgi:hypothetical protein